MKYLFRNMSMVDKIQFSFVALCKVVGGSDISDDKDDDDDGSGDGDGDNGNK